MPARTFNIADLFEAAVDEWPDREYVADENVKRTYAEMDRRANRLAHHLAAQGVKPGDHVGIYALNRVEWVEALWAIFKIRAVWININYRYVEDELAYLFGNADLTYLIVEPEYADRARAVQPDLPQLVMGPDFEAALAAQSDERDFGPRSNDDIYMLFTGGTTGMPKGVVWRHEDVVMALGGGVDITTGVRMTEPGQFVEKGRNGFHLCGLPIAPLMHGATQWSVMGQSFVGNKVILRAKFDPADVFRTIDAEKVNLVMITGDAMARPMLDHLVDHRGEYDLSSLFAVSSSAVLFSQACKDQFMDMFPNIVLTDAVGSSEGGANGITMVGKDAPKTPGLTVKAAPDSVVLGDDLRPVPAGVMGKLARTGNIPLRYHKDPEKSAATFVTGPDGTRYSIPGDFAVMQEDGSITLIGRGSVCINSGGEKIYPEEVEAALKQHPAVFDATVVGTPNQRWGEQVTALVQLREGATATVDEIVAFSRTLVADYKSPKAVLFVDQIVRTPVGKADYQWAKAEALRLLA